MGEPAGQVCVVVLPNLPPPSASAMLGHAGNASCVDLVKGIEQLGHLQQILDAMLYANNALKSVYAVGSLSDSAFRFLTPVCIRGVLRELDFFFVKDGP